MKKEKIFYKKGYRVTERGSVIGLKGKKIIPYEMPSGYFVIYCKYNKKKINCRVSRLQAFQKYGNVLYDDGIEVRHFNGVKADNSYSNILIGTHSQNMMDIPESIRMSKALYATSFVRKYNKDDVIKYHVENGKSYKKTMEHFNISSNGTLHYVLNNRKF